MIGAFNGFLRDQQRLSGRCRLTLVQFDDHYDVPYAGVPIVDAPDLTSDSFQPRGSTALLDAIGRTICETERRLLAAPSERAIRRVLVAILTDGLENASTDYTRDRVLQMIKTRTAAGWVFLFLGANQDAIAEGASVGIDARQSLNFASTGNGIRAGTRALSLAVSDFRSGESARLSPSRHRKKVH